MSIRSGVQYIDVVLASVRAQLDDRRSALIEFVEKLRTSNNELVCFYIL
jgi:hypothetical protein